MKICFLADASSVHVKKWASFFSQKGHEIHIISFINAKIPNVQVHYIQLIKANVINHSFSTIATLKKLLYLVYIFKIKKLIHKIKPDILHAHYATSYGILGALSYYHPFVISVWGSDILDFPKMSKFRAFIISYILSRADHITATSDMLTKEVKLYLSADKKLSTIPFGVNIEKFYPNNTNNEFINIGVVKSLEKKYGIEFLIRAFAKCVNKNRNVKLSIVGKGILLDELKNLCLDLNVSKSVVFHGFVDNELVPAYLNDIQIFVMPSIMESETFGVAVVEASACGIPVIASHIGGLPEVVVHGETGFLFAPGDVDQLTEYLEKLINNPGLRSRMGIAGRNFVLQNYNWEKNAMQMQHLYLQLLKNLKK